MQIFEGSGCTHSAIKADIPFQIWEGITAMSETGWPVWLIRLVHNKLRYIGVNYSQCYVYYLSPKYLYQTLGPILFLGILIGLWFLFKNAKRWRLVVLALILTYPIVMIFELYRL